jgi:hypothetical protein
MPQIRHDRRRSFHFHLAHFPQITPALCISQRKKIAPRIPNFAKIQQISRISTAYDSI